ncbi:kinase-like domain-containing protein [Gorgonomyces haynaldii]|nr:kinase-like domain-containing protein [Gorgonomyces haynaldii]
MSQLAACEYKTGKVLGHGTYATVKEAVKIATNERYACKMISKKLMQGREDMIVNEINILKKVSKGHPNIVTLVDYFETPNNLYLVMDLCTGGELFDRICEKGTFFEKDAAEIIHTVVEAVAYLHEQGIVHRDLKPENLLFKTKDEHAPLMIADFGLSKIAEEDKMMRTTCGTPGYMAPEILERAGYGKPVDMWAVGVMTYFLLCGYMPFDDENGKGGEQERVLAGRYQFDQEYWSGISDDAKDFIRKLLIVDPTKRLTAREALRHKWIDPSIETPSAVDLFQKVRQGFDARKMFKKALGVVKAVNTFSKASLHKLDGSTTSLNASMQSLDQIETSRSI